MMKRWIIRASALPFVAIVMFGLALGQSGQPDDPSRFLANSEVRAAVDAQTPLTSVPIQPYGSFYLVDVEINDQGPFKFVIDTGTTSTILDSVVAEELGLLEPGAHVGDRQRVVLDALDLGSARFADVDAELRDLDGIWGEGSPSGVLGFDLFGDRANPFIAKAANLRPQSGEGDDIRSAFNKNVDRVRLMVLLSPT